MWPGGFDSIYDKFMVFGESGSLAERWAKEHGVSFQVNGGPGESFTPEFLEAAITSDNAITGFNEYDADWTNLVIPEGIVGIGERGLAYLRTIKSVTFPDSLTYIGDEGLCGGRDNSSGPIVYTGKIERVNFGRGLKTIGYRAFMDQQHITELTIPDSVESIDQEAFCGLLGLKSVTLGKGLTSLGESAFTNCIALESVTFNGTGLTALPNKAFSYCKALRSIVLPDGLKTVGAEAFAETKLDSITIPASVTSIAGGAFDVDGFPKVVYGVPGSFAEDWAAAVGVPFSPVGSAPAPVEKPALPEVPDTGTVTFSTQTVSIDGKPVGLPTATVHLAFGDVNYVYVRDLAMLLTDTPAKFDVGWDGVVNLLKGKSYTVKGVEFVEHFTEETPYTKPTEATKLDGAETAFKAIQLNDAKGGYTYYQLRDLGYNIGFNVRWDSAAKTIAIETDKPYTG